MITINKAISVVIIVLSFSGIQCLGAIIYVDQTAEGTGYGSSWIDACNYLQDALAMAQSGDNISKSCYCKSTVLPLKISMHF